MSDNGSPMNSTELSSQTQELESFKAPASTKSSQITTFETDELTALCPFDFGGPDFYNLLIRYEHGERCLESRSLKRWLESFRDKEGTAEKLAEVVYRAIDDEISPKRLYVRLEQARRGGIKETVEVGDRELGG